MGIFAPSVTSATDLRRLELRQKDYEALELVDPKENGWSKFVYHDSAELLEPTNEAAAELVARTGASSQEEREGVLQLFVSVNRTFTKVEDAIAHVEADVKRALGDAPDEKHARLGRQADQRPEPLLPFLRLFDENANSGNDGSSQQSGVEKKKTNSKNVRIVPEGQSRTNLDVSLRQLEDAVEPPSALLEEC